MASRFDRLIDRHITDPADRLWAHNFLAAFENHPHADRIAAMLPDMVALNAGVTAGEITQQQAWDQACSLASEGYGLQPYVVAEAMAVADDMRAQAQPEPAAEPQAPEMPVDSPEMKQLIAEARRDAAKKDVARFEKLMNAPQYSAEWKDYWQSPDNQRAYREALATAHGVGTDVPGELSSTSAEEARAALGVAPPAAAPATPASAPAAPVAPPGPAAEPTVA